MAAKGNNKPRRRAQLSCDTCRRYKRKCDRACPCTECRFQGKECSYDRAIATKSTARHIAHSAIADFPPNSLLLEATLNHQQTEASLSEPMDAPSTLDSLWDNSIQPLLTPPVTTPSDTITAVTSPGLSKQLEALVCSPNALHHIIAAWRREDDWYHEILLDSPFMAAVMQHHTVSLSLVHRYAGIIYAIVAIVAHAHPSELEAVLIRLSSTSTSPGFASAGDAGVNAEQASKAWLHQATLETDASTWQSEVFQTSFLLMKLCKFLGRWTEYKDCLVRDVGRLQRAKYHRLSAIMRDSTSSFSEISTRHRIFWHYFTLERLSCTFDGVPYIMQARNTDMLFVEDGQVVHCYQLCSDLRNQTNEQLTSLPDYVPAGLRLTLTPCGQLMARLGAFAGRCQDQVAALSSASTSSPDQRYQRADEIAAQIDGDLLALQARLKMTILPPQHALLVAIGLARIRRDVAILLCDSLQLNPDDALGWDSPARLFYRRRLDLARALIRCAVEHSGRVMLSLLGEPFFTNFICDAVVELAIALQKQWVQQGSICPDTSFDDLKSALTGRNLLVVIAKQCELAENHKLAAKACQLIASVVGQVFTLTDSTLQLNKAIQDTTRIVAVDDFSSLVQSFNAKSDQYEDGKEAAEWLDWIASYPALQHIFELPPSDLTQPFAS